MRTSCNEGSILSARSTFKPLGLAVCSKVCLLAARNEHWRGLHPKGGRQTCPGCSHGQRKWRKPASASLPRTASYLLGPEKASGRSYQSNVPLLAIRPPTPPFSTCLSPPSSNFHPTTQLAHLSVKPRLLPTHFRTSVRDQSATMPLSYNVCVAFTR